MSAENNYSITENVSDGDFTYTENDLRKSLKDIFKNFDKEVDCMESSVTTDVEQLKDKYILKNKENSINLIRGVLSCSPSSMLNESERGHYTRAMEELRTLLNISEKKLAEKNEDEKRLTDLELDLSEEQTIKKSESSFISDDVSDDTLKHSTTLPTFSTTTTTSYNKPNKSVRISLETTDTDASHELTSLGNLWRNGILRNSQQSKTSHRSLDEADIKAIHNELISIHKKLNIKNQELTELKMELDERESELIEREENLFRRQEAAHIDEQRSVVAQGMIERLQDVELVIHEKIETLQQNHQIEMENSRRVLDEKIKDLKRIKCSYEAMKKQNDDLRYETSALKEENERTMSQNIKLRKRLENLQRKCEYNSQKKSLNVQNTSQFQQVEKLCERSNISNKAPNNDKKLMNHSLNILSITLEWVCVVHLKPTSFSFKPTQPNQLMSFFGSEEYLTDRCLKILPMLVDIFRHLPLTSTLQAKNQLIFLKFVYWSLIHLEKSHQSVLSSTSRRLGEELLRSPNTSSSDKSEDQAISFKSSTRSQTSLIKYKSFHRHENPQIRILSSLIILRTLHQADVIANVIEQLREDLKTEEMRSLFIDYQATQHILLPYLIHKSNKTFISATVDIMLQMTMESNVLDEFLAQCSNEKCFQAISSVLCSCHQNSDTSLFEKLSIILQKLSKIKSNRKFFESFSISRILQDKYRSCSSDENHFLSVNLRSILSNLSSNFSAQF